VRAGCDRGDELLLEYAYGELEGERRCAFEAHLAGCVSCQVSLRELTATRQAMQLPVEPAPEAGLESLLAYAKNAVAQQEPPRRSAWRWLAPLVPVGSLAVALLYLTVASEGPPLPEAASARHAKTATAEDLPVEVALQAPPISADALANRGGLVEKKQVLAETVGMKLDRDDAADGRDPMPARPGQDQKKAAELAGSATADRAMQAEPEGRTVRGAQQAKDKAKVTAKKREAPPAPPMSLAKPRVSPGTEVASAGFAVQRSALEPQSAGAGSVPTAPAAPVSRPGPEEATLDEVAVPTASPADHEEGEAFASSRTAAPLAVAAPATAARRSELADTSARDERTAECRDELEGARREAAAGRHEAAIVLITKVLASRPEGARKAAAWALLIEQKTLLGHLDEALALSERFLSEFPSHDAAPSIASRRLGLVAQLERRREVQELDAAPAADGRVPARAKGASMPARAPAAPVESFESLPTSAQ